MCDEWPLIPRWHEPLALTAKVWNLPLVKVTANGPNRTLTQFAFGAARLLRCRRSKRVRHIIKPIVCYVNRDCAITLTKARLSRGDRGLIGKR